MTQRNANPARPDKKEADRPVYPDRQVRVHGFTLIEMIVVIGIIVILIGLLMPVVSKVRRAGYQADSNAFVSQLAAACQRYYDTFKAYPGPIPNSLIGQTNAVTAVASSSGFDVTTYPFASTKITGAENLVLGLCGGLYWDTSSSSIKYDPAKVGNGPGLLNASNPKTYSAFADAANLTPAFLASAGKQGHFSDGAGDADDTMIPEFVDRYPDALPILYLRGKVAVTPITAPGSAGNNSVMTAGSLVGGYDLTQIIGYTGAFTGTYPALTEAGAAFPPTPIGPPPTITPFPAGIRLIGVGKELSEYHLGTTTVPPVKNGVPQFPFHGLRSVITTAVSSQSDAVPPKIYNYPYDAYPYFKDPSSTNTPRAKDMFILISAGSDRVYGTSDDITSFGPLQ